MYVGRMVALGSTASGDPAVLYRVSSRSYPNRQAVPITNGVAIVPRAGFEADILSSPYISYSGLRTTDRHAVVSNGTHTDIIANKLLDGMGMRDALAQVLIAMDFEHDTLDTPRIAAVVEPDTKRGYLGVITRQALHVRPFDLEPGRLWFIATYELTEPSHDRSSAAFNPTTAEEACGYMIRGGAFAGFSNPVSAAAALWRSGSWDIASTNVV